MTATRFETPTIVPAYRIVWQDARQSLAAAGFIPLVTIGQAEHWVRDNKRVILQVDSDSDAKDCVCAETMLQRTLFVEFVDVNGTLVAAY